MNHREWAHTIIHHKMDSGRNCKEKALLNLRRYVDIVLRGNNRTKHHRFLEAPNLINGNFQICLWSHNLFKGSFSNLTANTSNQIIQITNYTPTKCTIFSLFILLPLHKFQPLQGHLQGARNLHLLYKHFLCLLLCYISHIVKFHYHLYITVI